MAGATLEYTYRYSGASEVAFSDAGARLSLATCSTAVRPDTFFRGDLTHPRLTADLLLALVRVVQSRFCMPANMLARIKALADPVVTCGEDRIRFEAFSACCGVYGRDDLLPDAVSGSLVATGTTNVDFNPEMRAALARIRGSEPASLTVGLGQVELEAGGQSVVERKVPLPVRWLKGFVEVQAHQARMEPRFEIGGSEARRFLQSLPRQTTGGKAAWVARAGAGLRVSMLGGAGAVPVAGMERLRILDDLARHVTRLRVYSSPEAASSVWEADCGPARFHLALSPETWRGFSGEGQMLERIGQEVPDAAVESVRAMLDWRPRVDVGLLAQECRIEPAAVLAALARLGARGLVGYDVAEGAYFHRELPFDLSLVENLQPRLVAARKLVAEGGVHIASRQADNVEAYVRGTDCEHHVRLLAEGARCTCPWFAKHPGDRGPCKHILATQIAAGEGDDD